MAMRPRGVRWRKPIWMRYGSIMSSMVSSSSPMATAMLFSPTGPPANFCMMVCSTIVSIMSSPCSSISSRRSAPPAIARLMTPSPVTCAKSRTRRSRRLAMRGVPRERRAISPHPSSSIWTPRMPAERRTMRIMSSTE